MNPPIVLDCDPGHDDAIALLIAGQHCELLGVTTVSGNVPLELTTRNALLTLQLLGLEVPVHAGAARPLVAEARHAEFIHGDTGLNGPQLPPSNAALRAPTPRDSSSMRPAHETTCGSSPPVRLPMSRWLSGGHRTSANGWPASPSWAARPALAM